MKNNFIIILLLATIGMITIAITGCSDDGITTTPLPLENGSENTQNSGDVLQDNDTLQENYSLDGTKWRLAKFVNTVYDAEKIPENLYDFEEHYTLSFDANKFNGISYFNGFWGDYTADYSDCSIDITNFSLTYIYEFYDGRLYWDAVSAAKSFTITANTLKLFYNDNNNYLLFNKIE